MERLVRVEAILQTPLFIVAVFVAVASAAIIFPFPTPIRAPLILAFFAIVPGFVVLRALQIRGAGALLALVVPISLTIDLLVATLMLYVGGWSPPVTFAVIAVACLGITALDARLSRLPLRIRAGRGTLGTLRSRAIAPHRDWKRGGGAEGLEVAHGRVNVGGTAPGPEGATRTRDSSVDPVLRRSSHRRTSTRSTVPDHLFEAPPGAKPTTEGFFEGLAERVERDR
jgi:hypothetical protein